MANKAVVMARKEARKQIIPLTVEDVLNFHPNRHFHENSSNRLDQTCYVWRTNGQLKTWKTKPGRFNQPMKYGLYNHLTMTENNVNQFHDEATCPLRDLY